MSTQTINIALPRVLVMHVDAAAKKEYRNRSELIREALRLYLKENYEWEQLFAYSEKQAKKVGINSEGQVEEIVAQWRKHK
jgi:metal-responsive CopG/Arc/MetJ family transcriptional regulator